MSITRYFALIFFFSCETKGFNLLNDRGLQSSGHAITSSTKMICSSEHHWPYLPNTVHLLLDEKRMLRVKLAPLATETFVGVDWGKKRAVASGIALKFWILYRYRSTIVLGYQLTTSNVSSKMKNNIVVTRNILSI